MLKKATIISFVGISYSSARMLIGAFSVLYLIKKNITIEQIGILKSFQFAVILFIDTPLSYLADKYSRKFSIVAAIYAAATWLLLMGIANSFYMFLLAEFFNAISLGLMSGTFNAYLYKMKTDQNYGGNALLVFSRYQKHQYIAMGVFALIGSIIYQYADNLVWFLAAAIVLFVGVLAFFMPSDASKISSSKPLGYFFHDLILSIIDIVKSNPYRTSAIVILGVLLQSLIQFWQIIIKLCDCAALSKIDYAMIFFIILLAQSFAGKTIEEITKKNKKVNVTLFLFISMVLSLSVVYKDIVGVLIFLFISFYSTGIGNTVVSSLFFSSSPESLRGTYVSSVGVLTKLVLFASLPLISFIIGRFGIYGFAVFCCTLSFATIFLIRNGEKKLDVVHSEN